jgi:hypothetical protein
MRLSELMNVFARQDIYIVGTGPSASVFPFEILYGQVCIGLNDAFKLHPAVGPVALMHHHLYSRSGKSPSDPFHENFRFISYPVVKESGSDGVPNIPVDDAIFYTYRWSHAINELPTQTKLTDTLFYTPEGSALHAGLQLAWILGARRIFVIGCDGTTLGGKHYADFNKNGFRDSEVLKRGEVRNYDSYVEGTLRIIQFLEKKGIPVINMSRLIGYHNLEIQLDRLRSIRDISETSESATQRK